MTDLDYRYIDTQEALHDALPELLAARALSIDTEADSLYRYRERVCFMQIGVGRRAFLVDTLAVRDLDALRPAFEDPRVLKIFHGADYDLMSLGRDFGIRFKNIFDTMVASQLIGREHLGLAALVREFHGVELDKSLTRHDWGLRPLGPEYIRYIAEDVVYLTEVQEQIQSELVTHDLMEEAGIEFARLAANPATREPFDPEGFRRIKGCRDIDHESLSVLRELFLLRNSLAERADKPPFKILGNQQILDAAIRKPSNLDDLKRIGGFSDGVVRRFGRQVLEAIHFGVRNRPNVVYRLRSTEPRTPEEQLACGDALRDWRRDRAAQDKRTTMAVLPNHVLNVLAEARPTTPEQLAAIPSLGQKRFERYGEQILAITRNPPPWEGHRKRHRPGQDQEPGLFDA